MIAADYMGIEPLGTEVCEVKGLERKFLCYSPLRLPFLCVRFFLARRGAEFAEEEMMRIWFSENE
ncbi:MAG: hypothetical protein K2X48_05715 [Chitinophagaceae bacterium]|nr:hypothetical protein [Chitinophagaceae bacterium]